MKKLFITDASIALNKAKKICSTQEKCISDIEMKLLEWGVISENIKGITDSLINEGYIDESRFAEAFANDKFRFSKWGKIKIEYALRGKKISSSNIKNAINAIDTKDYLALLKKELMFKAKAMKAENIYAAKAKLLRFIQSKGFESELAIPIINELLKTE